VLIRQPGAARRLTPLYRCIVQSVPAKLAARQTRLARCPACEHDHTATGRAVDIVTDGVTGEPWDGIPHPGLARLCLPHARAVCARARRRASRRLAQAIVQTTVRWPAGTEELAGGPDHDADTRATLFAQLPSAGESPPGTCLICLAGARAELARLAAAASTSQAAWGTSTGLCPGHLRDATAITPGDAALVAAAEFQRQAGALFMLTAPPRLWGRWDTMRQLADRPGACFACRAREHAVQRALEQQGAALGSGQPDSPAARRLCVRHVLSLLELAPAAGLVAVQGATATAHSLAGELGEAFDKDTWPRRHEPKGPETTAWVRAAAFLDGQIFGGGPPPRREGS
jgi:hypothetical protein